MHSELIIDAMKEYALQAIEEQLKIAANEAIGEELHYGADKDSILNCTRVTLL